MMFGTGLYVKISWDTIQKKMPIKLTPGMLLVYPGMVHSLATVLNFLRPFILLFRHPLIFESRFGGYRQK
jgi:hypothetical protein